MEADTGPGSPEVLMGYVLIDDKGVIAASGAQAAAEGRHAFSAIVPEGRYTLRVAGIDAVRRNGLVERPFIAATASAGSLRVSSLILAPAASGQDVLRPIVYRTSEDRMTAYIEVVAAEGTPPNLHVRFEVLGDNGASPLIAQTASSVRADGRLIVARANLGLSALPPGSYQARAVLVADGRPVGQVVRPFSYTPR
jgi:hypothetical protein